MTRCTFLIAATFFLFSSPVAVRADTATTSVDPNAAALSKAQLITAQATASPASGLTGAVTTKTNAGQIEADILMARALTPIARTIIDAVKPALGGKTLVVFSGTSGSDLSLWELFDFQTRQLTSAFQDLSKRFKDLESEYAAQMTPRRSIFLASANFPTNPVTSSLGALSRIVSFAQSDYEVGGIAVDKDDDLLIAAIAAQPDRPQMVLPTRLLKKGATDALFSKLGELDTLREKARSEITTAKVRSDELNAKAKSDASNASKWSHLAALYSALLTDITATSGAYDGMRSAVTSTDEKSPMPMHAIVLQKAIADAIDASGYALFVHMHSSAGGYYTKKNLWTFFGGMPFFVSGGAVVSYTLLERSTGVVTAAGVLPFECGYIKATKVASNSMNVACTNR